MAVESHLKLKIKSAIKKHRLVKRTPEVHVYGGLCATENAAVSLNEKAYQK